MRTQGFSLLEVLVAIVVFSLGMLGIASLQINNLKLSEDSLLRTKATLLAIDISDRMRSNPQALALGLNSPYHNPTGSAQANSNCLGMNSTGTIINTQCTSTEIAQHDFYEWNSMIRGAAANAWQSKVTPQLPNGNGIVCIDSTPNDGSTTNPACDGIIANPEAIVYAIKLWWTEGKDNHQAPRRYVVSFSP